MSRTRSTTQLPRRSRKVGYTQSNGFAAEGVAAFDLPQFQFHARDLNLVMGPPTEGAVIPFRVTLDGHAAGDAHGTTWTPTAEGS